MSDNSIRVSCVWFKESPRATETSSLPEDGGCMYYGFGFRFPNREPGSRRVLGFPRSKVVDLQCRLLSASGKAFGVRILGFGIRIPGFVLRILGSGSRLRIPGSGFGSRVSVPGFWSSSSGFQIQISDSGLSSRVSSFGFQVSGLASRFWVLDTGPGISDFGVRGGTPGNPAHARHARRVS